MSIFAEEAARATSAGKSNAMRSYVAQHLAKGGSLDDFVIVDLKREPMRSQVFRRKPIVNLRDALFKFPVKGSCPVCHTPLTREYAIRVRGDGGNATGYRQPAHECGEMVEEN